MIQLVFYLGRIEHRWHSGPGSVVGRLYRCIVTRTGEGKVQQSSNVSDRDHVTSAHDLDRLAVLMLLDRSIVARIVRSCPHVLELSHGDMAARLILLKSLFRGAHASDNHGLVWVINNGSNVTIGSVGCSSSPISCIVAHTLIRSISC